MLDLLFILRWNLVLGILDCFSVIMEECVSGILGRIQWMLIIVMIPKLCPLGDAHHRSDTKALQSFAPLITNWHLNGVEEWFFIHEYHKSFSEMFWDLRLGFIFLVSDADQFEALIPSDIFTKNSALLVILCWYENLPSMIYIPSCPRWCSFLFFRACWMLNILAEPENTIRVG